jgi:hypothetical protein
MVRNPLPTECTEDECTRDTYERHHEHGDRLDTEPATPEHEAVCPIHGIVGTA